MDAEEIIATVDEPCAVLKITVILRNGRSKNFPQV